MDTKKQVDKNHYNFSSYCSIERWWIYYWQLNTVINSGLGYVLKIEKKDYEVEKIRRDIKETFIPCENQTLHFFSTKKYEA